LLDSSPIKLLTICSSVVIYLYMIIYNFSMSRFCGILMCFVEVSERSLDIFVLVNLVFSVHSRWIFLAVTRYSISFAYCTSLEMHMLSRTNLSKDCLDFSSYIMQQCWANSVARCWMKSLSKLKLKQTLYNFVKFWIFQSILSQIAWEVFQTYWELWTGSTNMYVKHNYTLKMNIIVIML
jgi:hypothetical protein